MKAIIISTDPTILTWSSLSDKRQAITEALNKGKHADFEVEIIQVSLTPPVVHGRVLASWLRRLAFPYFLAGYHFVGLHMSSGQALAWGIADGLRGSNLRDDDEVGQFYFQADEHTRRGDGPHNQFIETCLHEIRHEVCRGIGIVDDTHLIHSPEDTITTAFAHFDFSQYRREARTQLAIIKLLTMLKNTLVEFLERPKLLHPIAPYQSLITQVYGTENAKWYPRSGHHIGVDFKTPMNHPVLAPFDGAVIAAGFSPSLGHYCHYAYTYDGVEYVERWLHLRYTPPLRSFQRGNLVCHTGGSGTASTNPHFHQDIWVDEVRLDLINQDNWEDLTVDPQTLYEIK